jgi:methylenetetrahydrofolate reductase (NADPH)
VNPLAAALAEGRFCYVVELVASALTREWRVLEVAARLARVPQVVAGSITSYAGGALGHDPLRVGTAARARGLTPNVHLTCVSQDRAGLRKTLDDMHALGVHNVFALTGDYPRASGKDVTSSAPAVFDLDSVQLVRMIAEMKARGVPFHTAVAVSPFKYVEADCMYQYLKLEKKIAAGADVAITQVGWDAAKFAELRDYLRERGLRIPLLGNVYVLGPKAAEKMATGQPPGCWVSPELLAAVRAESSARDGGLRARLERAAATVAILRGLGYAGAYIGGTHDADAIAWIIRRADALAPRWTELAAGLSYGRADGFYVYGSPRAARVTNGPPAPRTLVPRALDAVGRLLPVTRDTWLRRRLRTLAAWADRHPAVATAMERLEMAIKEPAFGCQACGNCVLGHMEYVCPQTCPKQMRNGPCGGTDMGRCEVVDQPCIWVDVYARARADDRVDELKTYVPPPDRSLRGTSSWINYFLERDSRPGREGGVLTVGPRVDDGTRPTGTA